MTRRCGWPISFKSKGGQIVVQANFAKGSPKPRPISSSNVVTLLGFELSLGLAWHHHRGPFGMGEFGFGQGVVAKLHLPKWN
jgi:hypothetical protein